MIGRLHGKLLEKQPPFLLLDVQGVGYEVQVSLNTFFDLPDTGATVTLFTHFVVREDAQQLFGFGRLDERTLFRDLIKVNGVGPKMALAILSGMNPAEFAACVERDDVAALVKLPGVGKKTAERLLVEMRDKVAGLAGTPITGKAAATALEPDIYQEAESALVALGYKPQDAARMIGKVPQASATSSEELIRMALRNLGS